VAEGAGVHFYEASFFKKIKVSVVSMVPTVQANFRKSPFFPFCKKETKRF
jgi:hypothetical protein